MRRNPVVVILECLASASRPPDLPDIADTTRRSGQVSKHRNPTFCGY
jgi:hypothetical protein